MTWNVSDKELSALVASLTLEEKMDLLNGRGLWHTAANYRLNIPELLMTDGTYGVRYSIDQIDGVLDDKSQLEMFLTVVNADATHGVAAAFGSTRPATCFPNGSSFACAWDTELAHELGAALAAECQAFGVNILLGPGINIRRTPLAGRSYEYYSEDPMLTGDIAAAVINGLQENGVGASLKHFACNNSEVQRTTMSSVVEERALREIYLAGFERAIRKSDPWTVMSSYNRLNDVQAAENHWLLTEVLRDDWGYEGVVVSDWHGIKNRPASLLAGNDLDMPESKARKTDLMAAVTEGRVPMDIVDASCLRLLKLVRRGRAGIKPDAVCDFDNHHALSRQMAAESLVLLKNEAGLLPVDREQVRSILVVGQAAMEPVIQGSGCATTRPTKVDVPLDEIRALAGDGIAVSYRPVADFDKVSADGEAAFAEAAGADLILFFGNTDVGYDGEGSDRVHLHLDNGQDALIASLSALNPKIAVILATPDAVEMPWIGDVGAVLAGFFAGQGAGYATASAVFGESNPSGKLTVTFPVHLEDVPGYLSYPGENGRHVYSEGIHVGYRYYDARRMEPLFPFGFGLSYTRFAYSNLSIDADRIAENSRFTVSFDITNTGKVAGKEIAQLYSRPHAPRLHRPLRELKGFAKVSLEPGETKRVGIAVDAQDLRYFDPEYKAWLLDAGDVTIEIGASSRDIHLEKTLPVLAAARPSTRLDVESQPYLVLENPLSRERFIAFLQEELEIDAIEAGKVLEYCSTSFLGIHNTVAWFAGDRISKTSMSRFLDSLNKELNAAA